MSDLAKADLRQIHKEYLSISNSLSTVRLKVSDPEAGVKSGECDI